MADRTISRQRFIIDSRFVCVQTSSAPAPDSPTLLLVHGGWGGAAMHWATVWHPLAEHVRIIAPELPGMGFGSDPHTATIPGFSHWLARLLDHLEIEQVWVAGNSMGGAIAWQLALDAPDRVKGMILINGGPMPPLSKNVRRFAGTRPGRIFVRAFAKRIAFSPKAVGSAFADVSRIPEPLIELSRSRHSPQLWVTTHVIIHGTTTKLIPRQPGLIIWGTGDRLHGNRPDRAMRLKNRLPDAQLIEIPDAGHMPQVEQPRLVIEAISAFMGL